MSKYKNKKTWYDNVLFDSGAEAKRYQELMLMQSAGEIRDLERQPEFILLEDYMYMNKKRRGIKYRADFQYIDCREERRIVEDVKGFATADFKLKQKLFQAKMIGIELRIIPA